MIEVAISIINWISSHPDINNEFEKGTLKLENIPWNRLLPVNIDFTKQQIKNKYHQNVGIKSTFLFIYLFKIPK